MNWHNLDKNKCPKCNKKLLFQRPESKDSPIYCLCGFKIRSNRMKEIIAGNGLDRFKGIKHYRPKDENPE